MSKIYFADDKYEHNDLTFTTPKNPNAMRDRNTKAKELRAAGWEVKSGTTSFEGLGYGQSYWLEAKRLKSGYFAIYDEATKELLGVQSGNKVESGKQAVSISQEEYESYGDDGWTTLEELNNFNQHRTKSKRIKRTSARRNVAPPTTFGGIR